MRALQVYLLIIVLFLCSSCLGRQEPGILRDMARRDTGRQAAEETLKFFAIADRCDPFPCFDRFELISVENLLTPLQIRNTGAVRLSVQTVPEHVAVTGIVAIESAGEPYMSAPAEVSMCRIGDYLISLTRSDLFSNAKEHIKVCYRVTGKGQ